MQQVAKETWIAFDGRLERARVSLSQRPGYRRWVRFYLDFCHKYGHAPRSPESLEPFLAKLTAKNQSPAQRIQASDAVRLMLQPAAAPAPKGQSANLLPTPPRSAV